MCCNVSDRDDKITFSSTDCCWVLKLQPCLLAARSRFMGPMYVSGSTRSTRPQRRQRRHGQIWSCRTFGECSLYTRSFSRKVQFYFVFFWRRFKKDENVGGQSVISPQLLDTTCYIYAWFLRYYNIPVVLVVEKPYYVDVLMTIKVALSSIPSYKTSSACSAYRVSPGRWWVVHASGVSWHAPNYLYPKLSFPHALHAFRSNFFKLKKYHNNIRLRKSHAHACFYMCMLKYTKIIFTCQFRVELENKVVFF